MEHICDKTCNLNFSSEMEYQWNSNRWTATLRSAAVAETSRNFMNSTDSSPQEMDSSLYVDHVNHESSQVT